MLDVFSNVIQMIVNIYQTHRSDKPHVYVRRFFEPVSLSTRHLRRLSAGQEKLHRLTCS